MATLVFFILTAQELSAQSTIDNTRANQASIQASSEGLGPSDIIYQFASADDRMKIVGDTYYNEHWTKSIIRLYDDKFIKGYLTRYDIKQNEIEFVFQQGIKVISGNKVKSIEWIDSLSKETSRLFNTKDFTLEGSSFKGFAELIIDGKIPLFKKVILDEIPPTFNSALNVGTKDLTIVKKVKYFFAVYNRVYEVKKKQTLKSLQPFQPEIQNFCKTESISWTNEQDLKRLFAYVNANP